MGNSLLQSTTPATDNGVRDGKSNQLAVNPTLMVSTPWAPRAYYKLVQPVPGVDLERQHALHNLAYAATQGLSFS